MDNPQSVELTTNERLDHIESTIKQATIRVQTSIDANSLKALSIGDWFKIMARIYLASLVFWFVSVAIVGLVWLVVIAAALSRR